MPMRFVAKSLSSVSRWWVLGRKLAASGSLGLWSMAAVCKGEGHQHVKSGLAGPYPPREFGGMRASPSLPSLSCPQRLKGTPRLYWQLRV